MFGRCRIGDITCWRLCPEGEQSFNLGTYPNSERFIQGLSARGKDGKIVASFGNNRAIHFHSFSEVELQVSEQTGYRQIIDRFGNTNIVICVDHDNDGMIEVLDDGELKQIRATVTAYSIPKDGEKAIKLWD